MRKRWSAAELLARFALDRDLPPVLAAFEQRLSSSRGGPEYLAALEQAAAELAAQPFERIGITARDGTRLAGRWMPVPGAKRAVLALHGWRGAWDTAFAFAAPVLRAQGCSVLYIDQRAHGESGGERIGFGLLERWDCLDWAFRLRELAPGLPLYLYGTSMGAASALLSLPLGLPEEVRGVVADSAFTSPLDMLRHMMGSGQLFARAVPPEKVEAAVAARLGPEIVYCSVTAALRETGTPVLLIHGEADRFVPVEMCRVNYAACAAPKRLLTVPGADHVGSFFTDPAAVSGALAAFWEMCEG